MRLVRMLLVGVLAALVVAMPTVPAGSAQAEEHAWWWQPQTGLLGVELPAPPDVPADGLYVERGPDGATAIAAVRYSLLDGEADPALALQVASEQGGEGAAIAACVTTTRWEAAQGGRWDTAPGFDCEAGSADGARADDGSAWTWLLADLVRPDRTLDIVLVATGPSAFRVAFEAPTDASLSTVVAGPAPAPTPAGPPVSASGPAPRPPEPVTAAPVVVPQAAPPAAAVVEPVAPEVAEPAAESAASGPTPVRAAPQAIASPPLPQSGPSWATYALLAMIAGLVGSDLWAAGRSRGPRTSTGGIGRFARPRSEPPAPLW